MLFHSIVPEKIDQCFGDYVWKRSLSASLGHGAVILSTAMVMDEKK
jgi:hypothetical protein